MSETPGLTSPQPPNRKPDGPLRKGWTTGACAAAGAKAALIRLVDGLFPDSVTIRLPKGQTPTFFLAETAAGEGWAEVGITKDAGDDPDVTHGALIKTRVERMQMGTGLRFAAGEGVGTVTKPGLPIPPGEPAINPGPRAIIREALDSVDGAIPDLKVTVSIPGGEALARKTLNGRLGILGGLSVLGTTGIVQPFSCAAWIASIHRGIDVARAEGLDHVAACTGSTSERAVTQVLQLPESALLDMGDFAGGTLKYLRDHPIGRLTIAGGFAKLAKLARGDLDLHSSRSRVDHDFLASLIDVPSCAEAVRGANTAMEALGLAEASGEPLADRIADRARGQSLDVLRDNGMTVEVLVVDREGRIVGRSAEA
ncbi:MAG: cobalt-precorrin-5B (C(1))-methyltransferase [Magnetovibrionaceae bacterium]